MRAISAIAVCFALLPAPAALGAEVPVGLQEPETDVEFTGDIEDEIIVTAEKLARGEIPSPHLHRTDLQRRQSR